ncbi:hypothetical protein ACJX0J_033711, partial [Zea mays]
VKPLSMKYGLGIPDHDTEGRVVTIEFDNFYLLTAYVPNSGDGLKRLVDRAVEAVDMVLERNTKCCLSAPAGTSVFECLMEAGKLDEVYRLMWRMIDQGIVLDTISCNCIFEALCEAGRTADANQLRVFAKEKGFEADGETYSPMLLNLACSMKIVLKSNLLNLKIKNDTQLLDLIPFLEYVAMARPSDIRTVLASYQGHDVAAKFIERSKEHQR